MMNLVSYMIEKPVAAATMVEEISPVFFEAIHKYIFYENDSENVR
jgi:hypothetical protein